MTEELHWPDAPIEEIDDAEREALLAQAGPVGESARLAWQAYQAEHPTGDEPEAVARERTRLADLGQTLDDEEAVDDEEEEDEPTAATQDDGDDEDERAAAERKAAARGLEIRDFGAGGEWRVYDPRTGRMVARALLDEPLPPG